MWAKKMASLSRRALLGGASVGLIGVAGAAFAIDHFSIAATFNFFVPKEATSHKLQTSLAYGPHPRQKMDIYAPKDRTSPLPLVVFYYGGSWNSGTKDIYGWLGRAIAALGFVVAIIDYRLVPEVVYPEFLNDCALGVAYLRTNAKDLMIDKSRIALMGHSAGAYNALMLALDPQFLKLDEEQENPIKAAIGIAGPYDFYPFMLDVTRAAFEAWQEPLMTQPVHVARKTDTKFMLLHSLQDDVVELKNITSLEAALKAKKTDVTVKLYEGLTHQEMITTISMPFRKKATVLEDLKGFLRATLFDAPLPLTHTNMQKLVD